MMAELPTQLPSTVASDEAVNAINREYFIRHNMTKGYQLFSLLTPPVYCLVSIRRYGRSSLTANRFLRTTWIGGVVGVGAGGAYGYLRSHYMAGSALRDRRIQLTYDTNKLRADDHSTIGSILFGILTPAILWKRARAIHLVLGGAGIGAGVGLMVHHGRSLLEDRPPVIVPPSPVVPPS